MYNYSCSDIEMTNCQFKYNQAVNYGGGIYSYNSSMDIEGCLLEGNTCYVGGGIYLKYSSFVNAQNCTFWRNSGMGSGLCSSNESTFRVINCTFYGNLGTEAIYDDGDEASFILNSILWENGIVDIENPRGETCVWFSDLQTGGDYSGIGNIHEDPGFLNPGDGDFHLLADSPCIDTGCNWFVHSTDFEGDPRVLDGNSDGHAYADMGVDEYNPDSYPYSPLPYPFSY